MKLIVIVILAFIAIASADSPDWNDYGGFNPPPPPAPSKRRIKGRPLFPSQRRPAYPENIGPGPGFPSMQDFSPQGNGLAAPPTPETADYTAKEESTVAASSSATQYVGPVGAPPAPLPAPTDGGLPGTGAVPAIPAGPGVGALQNPNPFSAFTSYNLQTLDVGKLMNTYQPQIKAMLVSLFGPSVLEGMDMNTMCSSIQNGDWGGLLDKMKKMSVLFTTPPKIDREAIASKVSVILQEALTAVGGVIAKALQGAPRPSPKVIKFVDNLLADILDFFIPEGDLSYVTSGAIVNDLWQPPSSTELKWTDIPILSFLVELLPQIPAVILSNIDFPEPEVPPEPTISEPTDLFSIVKGGPSKYEGNKTKTGHLKKPDSITKNPEPDTKEPGKKTGPVPKNSLTYQPIEAPKQKPDKTKFDKKQTKPTMTNPKTDAIKPESTTVKPDENKKTSDEKALKIPGPNKAGPSIVEPRKPLTYKTIKNDGSKPSPVGPQPTKLWKGIPKPTPTTDNTKPESDTKEPIDKTSQPGYGIEGNELPDFVTTTGDQPKYGYNGSQPGYNTPGSHQADSEPNYTNQTDHSNPGNRSEYTNPGNNQPGFGPGGSNVPGYLRERIQPWYSKPSNQPEYGPNQSGYSYTRSNQPGYQTVFGQSGQESASALSESNALSNSGYPAGYGKPADSNASNSGPTLSMSSSPEYINNMSEGIQPWYSKPSNQQGIGPNHSGHNNTGSNQPGYQIVFGQSGQESASALSESNALSNSGYLAGYGKPADNNASNSGPTLSMSSSPGYINNIPEGIQPWYSKPSNQQGIGPNHSGYNNTGSNQPGYQLVFGQSEQASASALSASESSGLSNSGYPAGYGQPADINASNSGSTLSISSNPGYINTFVQPGQSTVSSTSGATTIVTSGEINPGWSSGFDQAGYPIPANAPAKATAQSGAPSAGHVFLYGPVRYFPNTFGNTIINGGNLYGVPKIPSVENQGFGVSNMVTNRNPAFKPWGFESNTAGNVGTVGTNGLNGFGVPGSNGKPFQTTTAFNDETVANTGSGTQGTFTVQTQDFKAKPFPIKEYKFPNLNKSGFVDIKNGKVDVDSLANGQSLALGNGPDISVDAANGFEARKTQLGLENKYGENNSQNTKDGVALKTQHFEINGFKFPIFDINGKIKNTKYFKISKP